MEKKVGKIFTIFLLLYTGCFYASESAIILRMQDMNHESIDQAVVNVPFILQVELRNFEDFQEPHLMQYITGIENFKSSRSMINKSSHDINGVKFTKTCVNFVLKTDKIGNFTVGPLSLKDKTGKAVRSNRLIIPVGNEQLQKSDKKKEKYWIRTEFDKKQVYVGEKTTLKISFFDRIYVEDLQFNMPDFPYFFIVKNQNKPLSSMQVIDEEECSVVRLDLDVYPTESGFLPCHDVAAIFSAPEFKQKSHYNGAFDFFRALYKTQQQIIAPSLSLHVVPLPQEPGFEDVKAVGNFTALKMNISKSDVNVGQGFVATLDIVGSGNFEMFSFPSLVLPEGFKYYDSNSVMIDAKRSCKRYEFVIQADKDGTFIIPAQRFDFFHPEEKKYKSLYTQPITIHVNPGLIDHSEEKMIQDDEVVIDDQVRKTIDDFMVMTPKKIIPFHDDIKIPMGLFWIIFWLLIIGIVVTLISWSDFLDYIFRWRWLAKHSAFLQAWYRSVRAYKRNNVHQVYTIFIDLFAKLLGVLPHAVDEKMIIAYLKKQQFSQQEIVMWQEFYQAMLHISFAPEFLDNKQKFRIQTLQWIAMLRNRA